MLEFSYEKYLLLQILYSIAHRALLNTIKNLWLTKNPTAY